MEASECVKRKKNIDVATRYVERNEGGRERMTNKSHKENNNYRRDRKKRIRDQEEDFSIYEATR